MKKNILTLVLLFSLFTPISVIFAASSNIGIIQGIWFSEETLIENDTFRMYVALQNNSGFDVQGVINFFDNDILVDAKSFSALNNRVIESWVDISTESGNHTFSVKITDLISTKLDENSLSIGSDAVFFEKKMKVYIDTDSDGIADKDDTDDDNDGYSDDEEDRADTDPLDKDDIPVNNNESKDDSGNVFDDMFAISDDIDVDELFNTIPEPVQSVAENNNLVKNIALQVSRIQHATQQGIENAQKKASEKENTIGDNSVGKDEISDAVEKNLLSKGYNGLLGIASNLARVWWIFPILIFAGIWLLLKIVFKIFGRRFRK